MDANKIKLLAEELEHNEKRLHQVEGFIRDYKIELARHKVYKNELIQGIKKELLEEPTVNK